MKKFTDIVAIERLHVTSTADVVSRLQSVFKSWYCNDRFNVLNQYSNIAWADLSSDNQIYAPDYADRFSVLMDERAKQIIHENQDKTVIALWSGGVDSTGYVCALIKNGIDLKKLTVLATRDSAGEHRAFIQFLKNKGVSLVFVEEFQFIPYLREAENSVIVDGCCADFIFGGNTCLKHPDLYHMNWQDGLKTIIARKEINLAGRELDEALFFSQLYQDKLGIQCKQFCEFTFLFMFGHQWSYYPHFVDLKIAPSDNCQNVITFYDTVPFQRYAMSYFERITKHNPYTELQHYKYDLKKYIYDFDGDEKYFKTKGKVHSWHSYMPRNQIVILTKDGKYERLTATNNDRSDIFPCCIK